MLSQIIQNSWYRPFGVVTLILLPLSVVFCMVAACRRMLYRSGLLRRCKMPVPVIIVGNISVGGTGKTPLVIAITQYLISKGFKPGVVSRGYGGRAKHWPQSVTSDSNPEIVGDEAVLIAQRCHCPVSVGPDRIRAAERLVQDNACDVIVSDDGLQHLALQRDFEIVVIDGERRFGNGFCLPAGPLRELSSRANQVDLVVVNGEARANEQPMQLVFDECADVAGAGNTLPVSELSGKKVHAVCGIGNNERFFRALESRNIELVKHPFPDHYRYREVDVQFDDELPVVMTEKDAVKCSQFKLRNTWYLKVDAKLNEECFREIEEAIARSYS